MRPTGPPPGFGFGYLPTPQPGPIHYISTAHSGSTAAPLGSIGPTVTPEQETNTLPHAFTAGTLHDPALAAWNMDTGASSHLNNSITSLSENFNTCMYPSISFVRDNNCTIKFDAFGFFVEDFLTRRVLLRCHSTRDLYPVTAPSSIPHAFLVSQHTWHQRLGHPRGEVLRHFVSSNFISYNKEKPHVLCHACQLGKHVRLPFVSSSTVISSCFDIIHSDFRSYVRTQFKCEIKSFQCDHGGEFDNRRLHSLFAENGIQFHFSCPQTSQQNGKSKRMWSTVVNDDPPPSTVVDRHHLPSSLTGGPPTLTGGLAPLTVGPTSLTGADVGATSLAAVQLEAANHYIVGTVQVAAGQMGG
nr:hypothetical protein [Tanacetum cinerariifolium]